MERDPGQGGLPDRCACRPPRVQGRPVVSALHTYVHAFHARRGSVHALGVVLGLAMHREQNEDDLQHTSSWQQFTRLMYARSRGCVCTDVHA